MYELDEFTKRLLDGRDLFVGLENGEQGRELEQAWQKNGQAEFGVVGTKDGESN